MNGLTKGFEKCLPFPHKIQSAETRKRERERNEMTKIFEVVPFPFFFFASLFRPWAGCDTLMTDAMPSKKEERRIKKWGITKKRDLLPPLTCGGREGVAKPELWRILLLGGVGRGVGDNWGDPSLLPKREGGESQKLYDTPPKTDSPNPYGFRRKERRETTPELPHMVGGGCYHPNFFFGQSLSWGFSHIFSSIWERQ